MSVRPEELRCALPALCVFRNLLFTPPVEALLALLNCRGGAGERMGLYGAFVHSLAPSGYSFSAFLCRALFCDENPYAVAAGAGEEPSAVLRHNAEAELRLLSALTELRPELLCGGYGGYIPAFLNEPTDLLALYNARLRDIRRYGYGVFASAGMFRVEQREGKTEIVPVEAADEVTCSGFVGYERERQAVFDNTRALLEGRPAANVLLYGDAGTGKSSTVKACANHFFDEGLRLIELRKDQLFSLPAVMGRIAGNPLKFILFIDDLSFNQNDDSFSMLKAALEGSASARAANAVIYATSNRRHIVKERFSERADADDIHRNDTVQELMSLSDRFGLCVYFQRPDKAQYLETVRALAQTQGVTLEREELARQAEAFALKRGGRSPRAAGQFVDSLVQKGHTSWN